MAIARGNSSSGCGPTFSDEPPHHDDYIRESQFRRADERTRTADLLSLQVIGHALQGLADCCKTRISKPVSLPSLARSCIVLRSRWCQSGVRRREITRCWLLYRPDAQPVTKDLQHGFPP